MSDRVELDDPSSYSVLDRDDMYRRIDELGQQMSEAWRLAGDVRLPDAYREARSIVITGMGGSAIGGSLLESYGSEDIPVSLQVWRGYGLPRYVDRETLLIAVSYSGNTEETLSALRAGHERGAKLLAISTGGQVKQLATEWGIPLLSFQYQAQPRATLGYLFTPLVRVFGRLGFLPPQDEAFAEALSVVGAGREAWGGQQATSHNQAKQLAQECHGRAVVIYGAEYLSAAARRWKTQMNENAKNWSFYEEFPELDHNAIVGYERPGDFDHHVQVIVLHGSELSHRVQLRIRVTRELMARYGVRYTVAEAQGRGRLAQIYSLIALGDYVSYYLALLNGVNPTTIEPIDFLKHALAQQS